MKTSIKRFSKRTLSIVLAVMMLITTLTIGVVNTNAAFTDDKSVGDNGTITVYFKNTVNWGNVYVYFYNGSYWNDSKGSGSLNIAGGPFEMTKVSGSDNIYSYTYTGNYSQYISFTKDSQPNYGDFNNTEAVYRDDFNKSKPMYTPDTTSSGTYNNGAVKYYNNGSWSTYSQSASEYYLTGWLNKRAVSTKQNDFKFTQNSTNTNIYTLTYTFTDNEGGNQYATIYDGSNSFHPAVHEAGSGTVGSIQSGKGPADDPKWKVAATTGDTVTFTWNSSTKELSWEILSETLYNVTVASADAEMGTVSPATVQAGETTNPTITATPNAGYDFSSWTVTGGASVVDANSATTTVSATADGTVTASFVAKQTYNITVNSADGGSVTSDKSSAYQGETVTLTASPETGKSLTNVTVKDADNQNVEATKVSDTTYTFVMPSSAVTVTPTFAEKNVVRYYFLKNGKAANWSKLYIYLWGDTNNTWPGEYFRSEEYVDEDDNVTYSSREIAGTKYYYIEFSPVDTNYTNAIMNQGNSSDQSDRLELNSEHNGKVFDYAANAWIDLPDPTLYTITLNDEESEHKTASATVSAESSLSGEMITVTTSPATGYKANITVTNNTTGDKITVTDNQFKMPGSNVTVAVTYTEIPKYNVTVVAGENGTSHFIYNGTTHDVAGGTTQTFEVTEGDTIALDATPESEDYSFNKWVRSTDSQAYSNASVTDQTITQNVTYTSSFKETSGTEMSNMYLVYNTEDNNNPSSLTKSTKVYKKGNYIYAYLPDDVVKKGLTSYFALSSTTSWSNMYWVGNGNLNVFTDDSYTQYVSAVKQHYRLNNINYYFGKLNVKSDKVTGIKINLGELGEDGNVLYPNYEVIPIISSTPSTQVDIIAKDGTIRSTYQKYADMADTKFVSGHNGTPTQSTYYESASATVGSTVTITTTVQEAYRDKYYVRGFVVNGQTYSVNTSASADGVYTLTLPITEDMGGETLEVTPVYFYADDNDTITFYVKGFNDKVAKLWGNTAAAHFWYTGGSEESEPAADDKNAFGGYPGQPLLNEGGFYYVQVPKYLNGDTSKPVIGVTLNNYVWDDIHGGLVSGGTGSNCQTYDFKDFVRLSKLTGDDAVDNIIFEFKYKDIVENRTLSAVPIDTSTDVYKNGWEDLTDYYSRKVDIYGNLVTDENLSPVYVVSKGYQSGTTEVPTDTYGAYATSWTVYQDGSKVFTSNCAALINASSQNESLVGHPTYITYEKSIFDGDQKGNRSDGRWYYSKKGDRIEANVIIQYSDTKNGTYVTDNFATDSNIGAATGTSAYFTDDDYYGKTTESALIDESDYFNFNAESDADGQYTFLGWYQLNSDGEMTLFSTDQAAKSPKAGNATFVARFYKTPTGSLPISHKLYSTAPVIEGMPEVKGGLGACKVKVEIVDPSGNVIRTYDETSGSITISPTYIIKNSQNKLKITLTSTPAGVNTFYSTYRAKDNSYVTVSDASAVGLTSTVTTVRTVDISSLFDDDGNLVANSLNYYSDYVPQTKDYKITFNYTDRFGTPQIYVVKGTLSESYITTNGAVLSDDFVMKKAPYEDNFGETIKWNDADITYGTSGDILTANVTSIQTGKDVHLNYRLNPDDVTNTLTLKFGDLAVEKNADGTYKKTPNGKYYYWVEAPESYGGNEFSYWNIYSASDESDLVAKCYSRKFNYVLYKDYYIVPVFNGHQSVTEDDTYTTIQLLEYSRNQWTDEEGVKTSQTDRLYADFQLSFNKNGTLITDATDVQSCGIVFEVGTKLTEDLASAFKDHPERFAFDTDTEALKQSISAGSKKSAEGRNLLKTDIDPKSLSNKNRIEFYKGFANAKYDSATDTYDYTNAMYVMKAYSYMIDTDGNVTLSNPVYVNFYDIASMQYTVS